MDVCKLNFGDDGCWGSEILLLSVCRDKSVFSGSGSEPGLGFVPVSWDALGVRTMSSLVVSSPSAPQTPSLVSIASQTVPCATSGFR